MSNTHDADGHLTAIADGDGVETRIEWTGGAPTAIVAHPGQRTTLDVDASGYLRRVTAPGGRATQLTSTVDGLLTAMVDAKGQSYMFEYNTLGRLALDEDRGNGSQAFTRAELATGREVARTTALGRMSAYQTEEISGGGRLLTNTGPDGTATTQRVGTDASIESVTPDGMRAATVFGPDPRFGLQAALARSITVRTPAGLTLSASTTRTATLSDPTNLFSLQTQTDTTTINERVYQTVFSAGTRPFTSTTPAGRVSTSTVDAQGRVTRMRTGTLTPIDFTYDAQGRLTTIAQGARQSTVAYDAFSRPATLTDRVTTQMLPDLRAIEFGYDPNSNVTSLTPPGRPAHAFTYTPVDLTGSYTPPRCRAAGPRRTGSTSIGSRPPSCAQTARRPASLMGRPMAGSQR